MCRAIATAWVIIVTTAVPAAIAHGVTSYPYNGRNYTACLFRTDDGYNIVAFQVNISQNFFLTQFSNSISFLFYLGSQFFVVVKISKMCWSERNGIFCHGHFSVEIKLSNKFWQNRKFTPKLSFVLRSKKLFLLVVSKTQYNLWPCNFQCSNPQKVSHPLVVLELFELYRTYCPLDTFSAVNKWK